MSKTWIEVLKEYNENNKEHWCIPKKGTKSFERLQRIKNKKDMDENQAVVKLQSVARGFQYRAKAKKERALQALEKYKNVIPQSTITNVIKPNETYVGNEKYIWNQIKEENQKRAIRKQKPLKMLYYLLYLFLTKNILVSL